MKLKQLINKTYYGSVSYVGSLEDLNTIEQYILFNTPTLKEFKNIIVATNYSGDFQSLNTKLWKKHFPDCILIDLDENRGHSFGTADLDNAIINYCHSNNIDWVCKSSQDIIIEPSILEIPIKDGNDFYYMNGIGYGGMVKYNFNLDRIINEDFYPQTNFYFINTSKIDYLNNEEYINSTYNTMRNIPNYNGKIWEHIEGWSCEDFLKNCVIRNKLSKHHLVSSEKYRILLNMVKTKQIHDSSHKNIMIEGICHFQSPNQPVIVI
jgi:hypothetical protein|tara:strand:+ start:125 stop:919 length:795 start_codon:yes stop_codon:yes gene_type:complete